jgi:NAD(P)-dependent dehydrogenase (short-subunit alcohol dehydrogenase family)
MGSVDFAIVTGAGRGIGRAIARELARSGARILAISRTSTCEDTARLIRSEGREAEALQIDLADPGKAEQAVSSWLRGHPFKKIAVVMAAGVVGPQGPLLEADLGDWLNCYAVNVVGNLAVVKGALPAMVAGRFGRIVAFAGGGSAYAYPLFPAYSASKTAMVRAIENLHEDLAEKGDFAAVCLAPGAVETDMLQSIRRAGAEVRTTVAMSEPVAFVRDFVSADRCGFSGCFVHVRDDWPRYLGTAEALPNKSLWKLRRIEEPRS